MTALKPCPFCGKEAADIHTDDCRYYFVICNIHKNGCGASGAIKYSPEEAAEWWNKRGGEQT